MKYFIVKEGQKMIDEKIKAEFEKYMGKIIPKDIIELSKKWSYNYPSFFQETAFELGIGYISGFRAAERLAKIEVLEELEAWCKNNATDRDIMHDFEKGFNTSIDDILIHIKYLNAGS